MDCPDHDHLGRDCVIHDVCFGAEEFLCASIPFGIGRSRLLSGMILYLTYWFPRKYLAQNVALFMTATALAGIIGGPVSGALLEMHGL